MRIWSNTEIELVDTKGGKEWKIYDARADAAGSSKAIKGPNITCNEEVGNPHVDCCIVKKNPRTLTQSGCLKDAVIAGGLSSWKVGDFCPAKWELGSDYTMGRENSFKVHEMAAIMRPDGTLRFCKVENDYGDGTYDLVTGITEHGPMYKFYVPGRFIGKLPYEGKFPAALCAQARTLFDLMDADGGGTIDFHFSAERGFGGELGSDLGKRLLRDMDIDEDDMPGTMAHLADLDANGDGQIDKEEVRVACIPQNLSSSPSTCACFHLLYCITSIVLYALHLTCH